MIDASEYTITVKRVTEDRKAFFKATVKELPDIGCFGESVAESYDMATDAIETLWQMAQEDGRYFPVPAKEENEFSGRVTLRLSKTLHRKVAAQAEMDGLSLNSYLLTAIASYSGESEGLSKVYKEITKNISTAIFLATKRAAHFMSSMSSNQLLRPQPVLFGLTYQPLPKDISLLEVTNDG